MKNKRILIQLLNQKKARAMGIWLSLVLCGYLTGSFIGYTAIKEALYHNFATLIIMYKPAYNFIGLYRNLNSPDELKRLEGYYSLLQSGLIDADYLCDRFEKEQGEVNKRTIVWLLGFSHDQKKVFDVFSRNYRQSSPRIRKEMLRSLQRIDSEIFKRFITDQGIRGEFLEGL